MKPDISLDPAGHLVVRDAGVVLAVPYLMRLWSMLGLVKEQAFVDSRAAERATHLMQFVVFGEASSGQPVSALNRLLCGVPLATAGSEPDANFMITAREREVINEMLAAMITHWKAIGDSSIEGLREAFLRRQGLLVAGRGYWTLNVEAGTFDMLLDRLPWSYATCKFPWMPEALGVSWR